MAASDGVACMGRLFQLHMSSAWNSCTRFSKVCVNQLCGSKLLENGKTSFGRETTPLTRDSAHMQESKESVRPGHLEILHVSDMKENDSALLDAFICGFQRTTTLFFGRIVSNPTNLPHFNDWLGYSMTYNRVPFGSGNALHKHNSVEIFVALDGDFEIGYSSVKADAHADEDSDADDNRNFSANKGSSLESLHGSCHATVLKSFDMVACPAGVHHYYKNVDASEDDRQLLTILPGKPTVHWAHQVVQGARNKGAPCDDKGVLILNGKDKPMHAPHIPERLLCDGDMEPFVRHYRNSAQSTISPTIAEADALGDVMDPVQYVLHLADAEDPQGGWMKIGYQSLSVGSSVTLSSATGADNADLLVIVLQGEVSVRGIEGHVGGFNEVLGRQEIMKLPSNGEVFSFSCQKSAQGKCNDSVLLVVRSKLPHSFDFFFDPHKQDLK